MQSNLTLSSLNISNILAYNYENTSYLPLNQEVVEYEVVTTKHKLRPLAAYLKLHSLIRANNAVDITVIDMVNYRQRFNINYQLQTLTTNTR